MLFHQRPGAGGGLADPGQDRRAEQADLGGQRGRVHGAAALADRLAHQALHDGDRLGGLGGPAPRAFRGGIGDGLQLAPGVRTAKLVIRARVGVIGSPASWTATPANEGRTPIASIARLPRFGAP